jgi:hypothetical protein
MSEKLMIIIMLKSMSKSKSEITFEEFISTPFSFKIIS